MSRGSRKLPFVVTEGDAAAEEVHELVEGRRGAVVGEDLFLGGLAGPLVQHAELERVDEDVLVVGGDRRRRLRPRHRHEALRRQLLAQQLPSPANNKSQE